jgi:hypothetical protein
VLALPGGVVWAYDGTQILRSVDEGAHWRAVLPTWVQEPTALQVTGAFFLTARDAWAVTDHQWPAPPGVTTVWQTTDGGVTWHKGISFPGLAMSDVGSPLQELVFADALHGYALDYGYSLWATADGGRTWGQLKAAVPPWQAGDVPAAYGQGCGAQGFYSLSAVSAKVLFLTTGLCPATEPRAWRSTDGGLTWAPARLPAPTGGWAATEARSYPSRPHQDLNGAEVVSTRFFAGGAGVMAVTTRPGYLVVYTSGDSGASWRQTSSLATGSLSRPAGFDASSPSAWELPAPAGLYLTEDGGRKWDLQRSGLSLPAMAAASFASGPVGIGLTTTGGASGGFRTTDDGRSWQPLAFPDNGSAGAQAPFSAVGFVTPAEGWLGGDDGVAATTDGGQHWARELSTSSPVEELSFADAEHGWALTSDQLFATSNGGQSWSTVPADALGAFSAVQLVSASFGVAVVCGVGGTRALATYDQGQSWQRLRVPGPDGLACDDTGQPAGGAAPLCFGTPQVGWAVVSASDGKALMEHSTDGGLSWSAVASFEPTPAPLACQGTSQAWVGFTWIENMSIAGDLAGTADGGRSWSIGKFGKSPFNTPRMSATDGVATKGLGTAKGSASAIWAPPAALAVPAPGDVVDLWDDYGSGCGGLGLLTTQDGGTDWTEAPSSGASRGGCQGSGLPFLAQGGPGPIPSVSFPSPEDGFVLGPAAQAGHSASNGTSPTAMALVGTTDGGQSWRLVASFA